MGRRPRIITSSTACLAWPAPAPTTASTPQQISPDVTAPSVLLAAAQSRVRERLGQEGERSRQSESPSSLGQCSPLGAVNPAFSFVLFFLLNPGAKSRESRKWLCLA